MQRLGFLYPYLLQTTSTAIIGEMLTHINRLSISRSADKVHLGTACGDPCHSCQVIACLWAPPVATPFSFTYVIDILEKIGHHQWRPTYLHTYIISLWAPPGRLSFLLFGHRQWRPLSVHFSGHRLWRLSFLLFGHRQWRPLSFHFCSSQHFSGVATHLFCHRVQTYL